MTEILLKIEARSEKDMKNYKKYTLPYPDLHRIQLDSTYISGNQHEWLYIVHIFMIKRESVTLQLHRLHQSPLYPGILLQTFDVLKNNALGGIEFLFYHNTQKALRCSYSFRKKKKI